MTVPLSETSESLCPVECECRQSMQVTKKKITPKSRAQRVRRRYDTSPWRESPQNRIILILVGFARMPPRSNVQHSSCLDKRICECNYLSMHAEANMTAAPANQYVDLAVEVFSMLADPTRVRIILALRDAHLRVNHPSA